MTDAERQLRRELREHPVPEEREAEERGWRVVAAAATEGVTAGARRSRTRRRALQALAAVGLIALVASPAGAAVRHWVADRITGVENARPVLDSLPGSGSILVQSERGPWVVRPDGGKRLLGAYSEASWSPHGFFVAATNRRELAALEPDGTVRWAIGGKGPLRLARWNRPDGYRIAYLDGRALRVIDGDGTDDRLIAARVAAVAPAWKAGPSHVLAYSTENGAVEAIAADTRTPLFTRAPGAVPISLQWASGRLLVVRRDGMQLLNASGRMLWGWAPSQARHLRSAAVSPRGGEIAAVVRQGGTSSLLLLGRGRRPRVVFAGPGRFEAPVWSPDGRWLLLPWASADQWLFLNLASGSSRPHAVANVAGQFAPGRAARAGFPTVVGWCCTR